MSYPEPLGGPRPNSKNIVLKIVILGDSGVGKSSLMRRYVNNDFNEGACQTIGVHFLNKDILVSGEKYTIQIWDTAGQERFKSLRTPFYRGTDICMLTFSVNDRTSFRNLSMWRNEFIYYSGIKDSATFPFIVVANKVDSEIGNREVGEAEVQCWCNENGKLPYIETSAKDAINVEAAFAVALESWKRFEELLERINKSNGDTVNLSRLNRNNKRSCCSGSN